MVRGWGSLVVAAMLSSLASGMEARGDEVPEDKFADITLKILTYDKNLDRRVSDTIYIGIVGGDADQARAERLAASFRDRQSRTVSGHEFEPIVLRIDDPATLEAAIEEKGIACLVMVGGEDEDVKRISELSRRHKVLSVTSDKNFVEPLSLALVAERSKVRIYRSDRALEAEQIELASDFLTITRAR